MLSWSKARARAFLAAVHFTPHRIPEYFTELGSVQYDPLKPVGRNIDLVFQSRVPAYRVDDWEEWVYGRGVGAERTDGGHGRRYYDAWDKQACIVPVEEWPWRRVYHRWHHEHWRRRVFDPYPEAVRIVEAALAERGPCTGDGLADLELPGAEDREARRGSWYGPRLVNHVLKALWFTGRAVTSHRVKGRHVYAVPERVIPAGMLAAPNPDERENLKWILLRRHRTAGLLRPNAPTDLWSMKISAAERRELITELVDEERLIEIDVDGRRFHTTSDHIDRHGGVSAGGSHSTPRVRFLAPLDALLWDRAALRYLYDFDYVWEVYKPAAERRFGYYVLPIMYGADLVGRLDSRLENDAWAIRNVWWEDGFARQIRSETGGFAENMKATAHLFLDYLGVKRTEFAPSVPPETRELLGGGASVS